MKGTAKQITWATTLIAEFVSAAEHDIGTQQKMVDTYKARMAAGDPRDYSQKCADRERMIEEKSRQIEFVKSLDDAAEIIDVIKYGRIDAHMRAHGLK